MQPNVLEREEVQQTRPPANICSLISHHFVLLHLCSSKIEFHPGRQRWHVHSFCFSFAFLLTSGSWHALSVALNAFMNLTVLRKYQYVLQNLGNCSFPQKWSLVPKSVPGAASLCSQWLPVRGSLRALTTLYVVIACIFYCIPWWDPWKQGPCLI